MNCPEHIRGPELQLSKSRSAELFSQHSVSVPAHLNVYEFRLSTPTWGTLPATSLSGEEAPYANGSMHKCLWWMYHYGSEIFLFNRTSLSQNRTQK